MDWAYNTRIIAIIFVVVLHVCAILLTGNPVGSANWWTGNIIDSFCRWGIPVLVMLSGALLLDPSKTESNFEFIRKRSKKIFLPLIFWSIFYIFWHNCLEISRGNETSCYQTLRNIAAGKPHYHMWFIYMISFLYLFTPYLRILLKNSTIKELKTLIIILFSLALTGYAYDKITNNSPLLFSSQFLMFLPYYFLGYQIRKSKYQPRLMLLLLIFLISWAATAFGCYQFSVTKALHAGFYCYGELSITVVPMSISMFYLLKRISKPIFGKKWNRRISGYTFCIYLIHPIFIELREILGFGVWEFNSLMGVILVSVLVLLLSATSGLLISKIPKIKRIV